MYRIVDLPVIWPRLSFSAWRWRIKLNESAKPGHGAVVFGSEFSFVLVELNE